MSAASPPGQSAVENQRVSLSPEVGELLVELSIAVRRHAIYPSDHPSLEPLARNVTARLARCFDGRDELAIGVAQSQLIIRGAATEAAHPVLSDLARRLHDHELGALIFRKGIVLGEVQELLQALSADPEGGEPLGRRAERDFPGWEHVILHPVGYEKFRLRSEDAHPAGAGDPTILLWLGLAQAVLGAEEPMGLDDVPEGGALAEVIRGRPQDAGYDKVIVGYLQKLTEDRKGAGGPAPDGIRGRVSELIRELDDDTLQRLLDMGGDTGRLQRFVQRANQGLEADAVMKLLRAGAANAGQPISRSMTRMLAELARHASAGPEATRADADAALRDRVEELIADWALEDPNPDDYSEVLDEIARAEPAVDLADADLPDEWTLPGPHRLVETALEVDAFGAGVGTAVATLVEQGDVTRLVELVDVAPRGSEAAEEIRGCLTRPDRLRALLSQEDVDASALLAIIEWMGVAAVDPLLDALTEAEDRPATRRILAVLSRLDVRMDEAVMKRLRDERWYVVRNLLALIRRWDRPPEGFDPMTYVAHPDPRVRLQALPLALERPNVRRRAVAAGLGDSDPRLVRLSLLTVQEHGLPDPLLPTLVNRVVRGEHAEDLRALAVRALDGIQSPLARAALVELADGGRSFLGLIQKVAEASPSVVAALRVLQSTWPDDARARKILKAARRSRTREIRAAARGVEER